MTDAQTYTVDEVAQKLGVSRSLVYQEAKTGTIAGCPIIRVGNRIFVAAAHLDRVLATRDEDSIEQQIVRIYLDLFPGEESELDTTGFTPDDYVELVREIVRSYEIHRDENMDSSRREISLRREIRALKAERDEALAQLKQAEEAVTILARDRAAIHRIEEMVSRMAEAPKLTEQLDAMKADDEELRRQMGVMFETLNTDLETITAERDALRKELEALKVSQ